MKRDMELVRKILFAIEKQYVDTAINNLKIEGYSTEEIAYHCKILYEAELISEYEARYADGRIFRYFVGPLTWEGHDYLDKIRSDTVWNKTKETIKNKGLPMIIDVIKEIASAIIGSMITGALNS